MAGNGLRILLFAILLQLLSTTATAQFYQRKDSVAGILKRGVVVERSVSSANSEKPKKKSRNTPRRVSKKKTVKKQKTKPDESKKDTVVARKSKSGIVYSGVKYRLGDRVIMRGDSGADVKSLANMLVKKLFLDEKDIIYTADGGVLYDGAIIKAVRSFQKVSGIYEDGMVGTPTLKALRRRNRF